MSKIPVNLAAEWHELGKKTVNLMVRPDTDFWEWLNSVRSDSDGVIMHGELFLYAALYYKNDFNDEIYTGMTLDDHLLYLIKGAKYDLVSDGN